MAISIMSDETRQQLEQARSYLMNDRAKIEMLITEAFDQALHCLTVLIGEDAISSSTISSSTISPSTVVQNRASNDLPKASPTNGRQTKSQPKAARQRSQPFDAKQLQGDFKGMSASEAIGNIMKQTPTQTYSTAELIEPLYGELQAAERLSATKSVSAVLMQGARSGRLEKTADKPVRYRLAKSAVSA